MSRVSTSFDDTIAIVGLHNPPGNRIDFAMREELRDAIRQIAASDARVVLVKGDGEDFCRGGDVREWVGQSSTALRPKIEVYAEALELLRSLNVPTIAAVQGACRGGGFELALSCDIIVAARSATFCFPEAASGILTLQGGAMLLAQRIGRARALEFVLSTHAEGAEEMLRQGAIDHLVDDSDPSSFAHDLGHRLSGGSKEVCSATKELLRRWEHLGSQSTMASWYETSMPLFDLAETQAAISHTARLLSQPDRHEDQEVGNSRQRSGDSIGRRRA